MKKIFKSIAMGLFLLSIVTAKAHQPDISSITLIEQETGDWTVQINAGILGFQYEVESIHGEDSYSSVEEFNQLLLAHLRENIHILVNGEEIELTKGIVKLGHAATVVFELSEVPAELNKVFIKNEGFKSIHNSQSIFSIAKEGLGGDQFILNEDNNYQVHVALEGDQIFISETNQGFNWGILVVIVAIAGVFGLPLYYERLRQLLFNSKELNTAQPNQI